MSNSITSDISVPNAYGPLLFGCLTATLLSGVTATQSILYLRLFPDDPTYLKSLVLVVWVIDFCQTAMIWGTLWFYFILNFGDPFKLDMIPPPFVLTVMLIWLTNLLVHCYYICRIFYLSQRRVALMACLIAISIARFCSGCATCVELFLRGTFSVTITEFKWLVTLTFSFCAAADIVSTLTLAVLLRRSRRKTLSLYGVIDALTYYALELGSLTGIASLTTLLAWLFFENHMISIGCFIGAAKLYANSLLATLIMRYNMRQTQDMATCDSRKKRKSARLSNFPLQRDSITLTPRQEVRIRVSRSVQYDDTRDSTTL